MAYIKTVWVDDSVPAINASNLNKIEQGIYEIDNRTSEEPWTDMVLANNWQTYTTDWQKAQYKKVGNKVVLRGLITNGTQNSAFTTLPVGYRPPLAIYVVCADDSGATNIRINPNGTCNIYSYQNWVSLSGIEFYIN